MLNFNFQNAMGQDPGIVQKPKVNFMGGSQENDPFDGGQAVTQSGISFNHTGDIAAKGDKLQDPTAPDFKTFNYAHPASDRLSQLLTQAPQQADYKPSVGRRIAAVIAGAAGGYAAGPKAGLDIGNEINQQPYEKAMTSYKTNVGNAATATDLEQSNIAQAMKLQEIQQANQKWTATYAQKAAENRQQAQYQEGEIDVRNREAASAEVRAKSTEDATSDRNWSFEPSQETGNLIRRNRATGEVIDTGTKVGPSRAEKDAEAAKNRSAKAALAAEKAQHVDKASGLYYVYTQAMNPELTDYFDLTGPVPKLHEPTDWKGTSTADPAKLAQAKDILAKATTMGNQPGGKHDQPPDTSDTNKYAPNIEGMISDAINAKLATNRADAVKQLKAAGVEVK